MHIINTMLGDIASFRQRTPEKVDIAMAMVSEGMTLVAGRLKAGFLEFTSMVRSVLCAAPLRLSGGHPMSLGRGELGRLEQAGSGGASGSALSGHVQSVQLVAALGPALLPPLAQSPVLQAGPSPLAGMKAVPASGATPVFDMAIFARAVAQEITRASVMPPPTGPFQAPGLQASPP